MWRRFALFEHYGRMTLTLDEIAEQVGLAPGTIKNRRARGEFPWIRDEGRTLTCDVADLARYIESEMEAARGAMATNSPMPLWTGEGSEHLVAALERQHRFRRGDVCGVYSLLLGDEVVYVGQSVDVHMRIAQHRRVSQTEWDSWRYVCVAREHLDVVERALIRHYRPIGNTAHNPDKRFGAAA